MGGTRLLDFHGSAKDIWKWAEERNVVLFASYIPSAQNFKAAALSRLKNDDTEWELAHWAFDEICEKFGEPEIDLFATRENRKCKRFCLRFPDTKAVEVDALTKSWKKLKFYAFPPFALILKCLQKIKNERAGGVMVVPNWPNQPWFPLFQELLEEDPIVLGPHTNLLLSPCRTKAHPRA